MTVELTNDVASVTIDPDDGCRLTSFRLEHRELLAVVQDEPWGYGSVVMAPWAGRLRGGRARWGGTERSFPTQDDGHALHGLVHSASWSRIADDTWEIALGDDWFAPCVIRQRIALEAEALRFDLEVHTDDAVPAPVGWHPWFRRQLDHGEPVQLQVSAGNTLEKETDGSTSLRPAPIPPKPWDDTFADLSWPVRLRWPDALDLEVSSDAPVAVIFDELPAAVCVEPQSGPPNEVNLRPRIATADEPLALTSTWRWQLAGARASHPARAVSGC
jgi:aldose 1-epimerase